MKPAKPIARAAESPVSPPVNKSADEHTLYLEFAELSQKIPKRPLVLFFGRPTFSDNSKYLFLATARAAANLEVVWCTFSKPLAASLAARGLKAFDVSADTRQTCQLLLHASVAVFCENPATALGLSSLLCGCLAGAQKIQLWHGVSVKPLDLMLIEHLDIRDAKFRQQLRFATRVDHFVSTASALDGFWIRSFGCTSLVRAGQPRNEVLVRPPTAEEMIDAELPPAQAEILHASKQRKFLVTPTWQRGTAVYIATTAFYERLARWAAANDGVVFVKQHPFLQRQGAPPPIGDQVFFLEAGVDIYPWMAKFDALITDYSSIMFDFMLTGRPIFTFNTRAQVANGFEPDYSLIPEGDFRYEFDADNFEAVVAENLGAHPLAAAQRELCGKLFETDPGEACAQLIQVIQDLSRHAVEKDFTLISPARPAQLTRIAV